MALFSRNRRRPDETASTPESESRPACPPEELDEFARRHLAEVSEQADALAATLDRPEAESAAASAPCRRRPSSEFENAPTDPFIPVLAPPPPEPPEEEPETEPETAKVIIDEGLLYGEPELGVKTTPFARVSPPDPEPS